VIEDPGSPEQWYVNAAQNVPGLIQPTKMSKRHSAMMLATMNAVETRRNKEINNKVGRKHPCFTNIIMRLAREFHFEIYHRQIVSSCLGKSVDKYIYCRCNESFRKIYQYL